MTIVDLDFEEQLKETNFPDLLEGAQSSQPRKVTSRRKVEKERKQLPVGERKNTKVTDRASNKKSTSGTPHVSPSKMGVPLQDAVTLAKNTEPSRVAVDPPVSPASGLSAIDHRDDNKSKHSSSSASKLTAANIEKLLAPPLHGAVVTIEKNVREVGSKLQKNEKMVKKHTHKSIKRDFIEQVSYEKVQSTNNVEMPVSTVQSVSDVPSQEIFKNTMGKKAAAAPETSSPKPHDINELNFEHKINSKSSSVSSIPHDGSHDTDEVGDEGIDIEDNVVDDKVPTIGPDEAHDLLERARDRIARQRLVEQVKALEMIVERKNTELEQLSVQLRRAVETKSDLVIAHNEIEKRQAIIVEKKEQNLVRMKQANIWLLEAQSIKEKELLNEIIRLTDMTRDSEEKRREELDDWERMHRNEMLEKDYTIARLSEELRKLGVGNESPIFKQQQRNNHKGYYDPTSIITGASKYFFN